MDERDDEAERASPIDTAPQGCPYPLVSELRRRWRRLLPPAQAAIVGVVALGLVASGAGLALGVGRLEGASSPAGLLSASPPGEAISAHLTREIARSLDRVVVDVNSVVLTPSGTDEVAGTGMLVGTHGLVVTNNHVVEGATSIRVTLPCSRRHYLARFVGADPSADVAVLRLVALGRFPAARVGDSSQVQLGQPVLAFGNSLGLGGTAAVTSGIISGLDRAITATSETGSASEHLSGMIETDAPIAPGNSGGPIVDIHGHVIGMDTAASTHGARGGPIAFALPINRVMRIVRWIAHGRDGHGIVLGRRAYLGIEGTTIRLVGSDPRGAVNVVAVYPGTPAARIGIEPGDVITSFEGRQVFSMRSLTRLIQSLRPGVRAAFSYESGGGLIHCGTVRLIEGPDA